MPLRIGLSFYVRGLDTHGSANSPCERVQSTTVCEYISAIFYLLFQADRLSYNMKEPQRSLWNVYLDGKWKDRAVFYGDATADEIKETLVLEGFSEKITIEKA